MSFIDETALHEQLKDSPKLQDILTERLVCKQIANQAKKRD